MTSRSNHQTNFVANGRARVLAGSREFLRTRRVEIAERFRASYAEQMANAGVVRRIWLRVRISMEIRAEMAREKKRAAPRDALYMSQS
jgi:hypothetical protein